MSFLKSHVLSIAGTAVVFIVCLWLNEAVFTHSEFVRGVNWVYLPAGVRLLATLLLGGDGALGLLIASWLVNFGYFFPHDPLRAIAGGLIATAAPYGVYRLALERYGLNASLANLTPLRLFKLALACSVASPLLHHLWFVLQGDAHDIVERFLAMCVGDFTGTMIVLYTMKGLLALLPRRSPNTASKEEGGPRKALH
jgi:hypothetical protein